MRKRSRLRKRVRDWLRKRKERKELKEPIPSFGSSWMNSHQVQLENPNEKITEE